MHVRGTIGRLPGKNRGLTIVELLIGISIIALLIALFIPAIGQARQVAWNNICKTYHAQIATELHNYAADNNSWGVTTPPVGGNTLLAANLAPVGSGPTSVNTNNYTIGGWTLWDTCSQPPTYTNGIGARGMAWLYEGEYITDLKIFYPPQLQTAFAGGGNARHWWNLKYKFLYGKYKNDPAIVAATGPWPGGASNGSIINGGVFINGVIGYRGGDWTPTGETFDWNANLSNAGTPGFNHFQQIRTDYTGYNTRLQCMDNLYENSAFKQAGEIHYGMGDGSVATSKNQKFIGNVNAGISSNATVYATWQDATTSFANVPSGPHVSGTAGGTPGNIGAPYGNNFLRWLVPNTVATNSTNVNFLTSGTGLAYWATLIEADRANGLIY